MRSASKSKRPYVVNKAGFSNLRTTTYELPRGLGKAGYLVMTGTPGCLCPSNLRRREVDVSAGACYVGVTDPPCHDIDAPLTKACIVEFFAASAVHLYLCLRSGS